MTSSLRGLSENEVAERRRRWLGNTASFKTSRSYALILRETFFVPVNIIMFALGLALVLLGQVTDALISVAWGSSTWSSAPCRKSAPGAPWTASSC